MVQKKYLKGLSESDKKKKIANIEKTKKLLKEGKKKQAIELSKKRPTTTKVIKKSEYTERFRAKFPNVKPETKKFEEVTGIPVKIQKEIINRGMGAFLSAGSRPNVKSPRQWGLGRLYAFYFKAAIDNNLNFDKDLRKGIKFKK